MNWLRAALGTVGVLVLAAGAFVLTAPATAARVSERAVAVVGTDYTVVAILGLAAFAVLLVVVALRSLTHVDQARVAAPEGTPKAPPPGDDLDRFLSPRRFGPTGTDVPRVRTRLREAAIRTEMRESGCTRSTAAARVDEGTWTDDGRAAAFLRRGSRTRERSTQDAATSPPRTGDGVGWLTALPGWLGARAPAKRTAREILSRTDEARRR